ncbi:MAG: hypothetical protein AAFV33_14805 [Chloroflexota bacterium]
MPIEFISFEDRVLHLKEEGLITVADADYYVSIVREYSVKSNRPIIVYIDATRVTGFEQQAKLVFIAWSRLPNVLEYVVVVDDTPARTESSKLSSQNTRRNTRLVFSHNEATRRIGELLAMN